MTMVTFRGPNRDQPKPGRLLAGPNREPPELAPHAIPTRCLKLDPSKPLRTSETDMGGGEVGLGLLAGGLRATPKSFSLVRMGRAWDPVSSNGLKSAEH